MTIAVRTNIIPLSQPEDVPLAIRELETRLRAIAQNLTALSAGGVGGSFDGLSGGEPDDSFGTSGGISGGIP